jgi:hypothetical protein
LADVVGAKTVVDQVLNLLEHLNVPLLSLLSGTMPSMGAILVGVKK